MTQSLTVDIRSAIIAARTSGLFVSLCTIQRPDGLETTNGSPSGNFVDVFGLVDIKCMRAVKSVDRITADQIRQMPQIESFTKYHTLLDDFYPQLPNEPTAANLGWRAIVDGQTFLLKGAEADSQRTMTRLNLEVAEV